MRAVRFPSADPTPPPEQPGLTFAVVALLVFAAALFGIFTRPSGFLAAFWPVNALLIGVFVRRRQLAAPAGWIGAFVGFVAADIATGNAFLPTLRLTAVNLFEVATGYLLLVRLRKEDQRLGSPIAVLYLFAICAVAAIAAALLAVGLHYLQAGTFSERRLLIWFVSEIASLAVTLPVVLTAPGPRQWGWPLRRQDLAASARKALPLLALAASGAAGSLIGGPGVLAFPIPALLWCALNYSLFSVSLLTMLFCIGEIMAVSSGLLALKDLGNAQNVMISLRLGVAFLAMGPLTVATINSVRNELLRSLEHAANHDFLTQILARGAFMQRSAAALGRAVGKRQPSAVLMLDIDHFKRINDRHGHAVGDQVLAHFASTVSGTLRETDIFGRIGGEEFAVLLPATSAADAAEVAERIRASVEAATHPLEEGQPLRTTVSIGIADTQLVPDATLEQLLRLADRALYAAKEGGRNRVEQRSFNGADSRDSAYVSQFAA